MSAKTYGWSRLITAEQSELPMHAIVLITFVAIALPSICFAKEAGKGFQSLLHPPPRYNKTLTQAVELNTLAIQQAFRFTAKVHGEDALTHGANLLLMREMIGQRTFDMLLEKQPRKIIESARSFMDAAQTLERQLRAAKMRGSNRGE